MSRGIFISYRRDTGSTMARMIYDRLRLEKQYDCFLDVEKLNAGNFREHISSEMEKCDIFLLILSRDALNRCSNPNDNVRAEILEALEKKLAIIPVTAEDFAWPGKMPEGLESIQNFNAIPYVQVYSEQFFERLYSFIETVRAENAEKENTIRKPEPAADDPAAPVKSAAAASLPKKNRVLLVIGAVLILGAILAAVILGNGKKDTVPQEESRMETQKPEPEESRIETQNPEPEESVKTDDPVPVPETAGLSYAEITAGASQADAAELPLSVKAKGKYTEGYAWLRFTTTADADTKYYVTLQNLTAGSEPLTGRVYDEYGNSLKATTYNSYYRDWIEAGESGTTRYMMFDSLQPETTYYIRIESESKAAYSIAVSTEDGRRSICTEKTVIRDRDSYYTATNQDETPAIQVNVKYNGRYESGWSWVAFTTGTGDTKYYVTLQNLTAGSKILIGRVIDEYGNSLKATTYNSYYRDWIEAGESGTTRYMMFDSLQPETTYYIRIESESKADYMIGVSDHE